MTFDKSPHGCHGAVEVSANATVVTAQRSPKSVACARVVRHTVAVGQRRSLTVQVLISAYGVGIGIIPVWHSSLSSDDFYTHGDIICLSLGCCWLTEDNGPSCVGSFVYGGTSRLAAFCFVSGDEVMLKMNRRRVNEVMRFRCNVEVVEMEPLSIGFTEEAALMVSFTCAGADAKVVKLSYLATSFYFSGFCW